MSVRLLQSWNAYDPTVSTFAGNVKVVKLVQPSNVCPPIVFSSAGAVNEAIGQSSNA